MPKPKKDTRIEELEARLDDTNLENQRLADTNERLRDQVSELRRQLSDAATSHGRELRERFELQLQLTRFQFEGKVAQTRQETTRALGRGDGAIEMVTSLVTSVINGGNRGVSAEDLMAAIMGEEGFPIGVRMPGA